MTTVGWMEPTVGGINPRKVCRSRFSMEMTRPDVIVADHGYDAWPFPGAPLLLYLSTADGRLEKAKGLGHITGYHHSVAVGDIDGDGDTDAFVTDWWPAFLINDGKGNLTRDYRPLCPAVSTLVTLQNSQMWTVMGTWIYWSLVQIVPKLMAAKSLVIFWGDVGTGLRRQHGDHTAGGH